MVKSSQHASSNVVSKKNENVRVRIEGKAGNPIWGCPKFGFPKKPDFLFLLLLSLSTTVTHASCVTAKKMTDSLWETDIGELEGHKEGEGWETTNYTTMLCQEFV